MSEKIYTIDDLLGSVMFGMQIARGQNTVDEFIAWKERVTKERQGLVKKNDLGWRVNEKEN